MEKKVYCLIEGRWKCLKYVLDEKTTDYESIMKKLMELINKDVVLKMMTSGKSIILQSKDPDRNNQLCDIEQDDVIPDKSDVHVLLIPSPSSLTDIDLNSLPIVFSENVSGTTNVNVSLVEPTLEMSTTEHSVMAIDNSNVLPSTNNQIPREHDLNKNNATHEQYFFNVNSIDPALPTPTNSERQQRFISPNSPLPSLTLDLQKKLDEDGILKAQKYLISFWASYLWETTDTKPTKFDYQNLATSIVQAYPDLKGGANECGIVKTQLSIWIRNHRVGLKKAASKKRDHDGNSKLPVTQAVFVETNEELLK